MADPITLKDNLTEMRTYSARVVLAFGLIVLCLMVLVVRYFLLQVVEHETYRTESERNRVHVRAVPAKRGLIVDVKGKLLAENRPSYTASLVKERIADLDATLAYLQTRLQLSDEQLESFREQLRFRRPFEAIPLKFNLNDEDIAALAVNQYKIPGVQVAAELARYYAQGELFAHVVGYTGRINESELLGLDQDAYRGTHHIGKTGLERYYERELLGEVGYENVEINAVGRVIRVLERTDPSPGQDLQLHLDANVQQVAYDAMGDYRGSVVALDVNTGGVIAFVSKPSFDANKFVRGVSTKEYAEWRDSPDLPLFNRALQVQYPPGSTIKPIFGLAGLDYDVVDAAYGIADPGWYQLPNDKRFYRDHKKWGHGTWVTLHQAVVVSCDTYFYDLAFNLGIDRMHEFGSLFGLGKASGIDLPGERKGLLPSQNWKRGRKGVAWYPGETLSAGIGQGYMLTTPLQLAVATATLASKGVERAPRLVKAVNGKSLKVEPVVKVQVKEPGDWHQIHRAMEEVVHGVRGTARRIGTDAAYRIAGKTGTAQVVGIKQGEEYDEELVAERNRDHALFIAFAPAEAPQIAIAAIVENGGHGGATAAPIVKKVLDAYMLPRLK
ncbi:MAG: penicillin-binding protein 2, partial [Pseudomonadales bacterium]